MKLRNGQFEQRPLSKAVEAAVDLREATDKSFDFATEITAEDIEMVQSQMYEDHKIGNHSGAYEQYVDLMMVGLAEEVSGKNNGGSIFLLKEDIKEKRRLRQTHLYDRLFTACCLYPELKDELGVNDEVLKSITEIVDNYLATPVEEHRVLHYAMIRKFLFPEQGAQIDLPEDKWEIFEAYIAQVRTGSIRIYIEVAAMIRLLYPDHFSDIKLDAEVWDEVRQDLDFQREERDKRYLARTIWSLAVLTADEARITDQGLELVNSLEFEQVPDLPLRSIL